MSQALRQFEQNAWFLANPGKGTSCMAMTGDNFSFGALLRTFRIRNHLTQQRLAETIGVHRSTLVRWEQGDYLPESKTIVLELARHLHLDDQETRQILEASLTTLAPPFLVPLPRNPYFTGREGILEALHAQLGVDQTVVLTPPWALYGLGGVGKTQIALEYAYRHALEYSAVFWIGAETVEHIVSSLLHIADALQLSRRDDKDQQRVVAAVQHWLTTHSQWFLIWDNVEDLGVLNRFLPATRSGAMLITTRRQALGTLARGLDLLPMEQEEGILFLLRRAKVISPEATNEQVRQLARHMPHMPAQYQAAAELVTALGGLPLALDQAGAYIEETGCSFPGYLQRYEQQQIRLLDQRGGSASDHPHSVAVTFRLSLARVEREQPSAVDVLRVCAFLHADAIPDEVFVEGAAHLGSVFASLAADPLQFDQLLAFLGSLSLVQRQVEARTISFHRLVQAVLKGHLPEALQRTWMTRVLRAISHLFPVNEEAQTNYWQRCERLLPHARICLSWGEQGNENAPPRIALLNHVAAFSLRRSRFAEAESLYQQAYVEAERALGLEHLLVAETLDGLAALRLLLARYAEAESLYQRALVIRERALGADHPQVATSLSGVATLHWRQGNYREAESHYQRALVIRERALGADHPQVATSLSELALIYRIQGKYEQAESLYQHALHIREQAFGLADPQVGLLFYHLAMLYLARDRYEEAKPLFFRAVRIWEEVLGSEDLDLPFALNGLAKLLSAQGNYEEAEGLFLRAFRIREPVLGSEHPQIAVLHHGLANLYLKQGREEQAEHHYRQALCIQENHLDQQHTETAETLHDLALLLQSQGKRSEAISLAERALEIRSHALGEEHAQTFATQALHTHLLQVQANAWETAPSEQRTELVDRCQADNASPMFHQAIDPSSTMHDPLHEFLEACCERHPRAWCRSADLWQVYERWVEKRQERYPLSRAAFTRQLKAAGCQTGRTNRARIWRGIALMKRETVTADDSQ